MAVATGEPVTTSWLLHIGVSEVPFCNCFLLTVKILHINAELLRTEALGMGREHVEDARAFTLAINDVVRSRASVTASATFCHSA